jgi:hypothetical protein
LIIKAELRPIFSNNSFPNFIQEYLRMQFLPLEQQEMWRVHACYKIRIFKLLDIKYHTVFKSVQSLIVFLPLKCIRTIPKFQIEEEFFVRTKSLKAFKDSERSHVV